MFELNFLTDAYKNLKSTLDDTVDRLNYLFTCAILLLFSVIVGSKQTFGSPLHCMSPNEFADKWEGYINNFCFVSNTYISKLDLQTTPDIDTKSEDKIFITYYQWIPFIFAIQGIMFHFPHYLWMILQKWADTDFQYIVEKCNKNAHENFEERQKFILNIAKHIEVVVKSRSNKGYLNGMGNFATLAYLFNKALNMLNLALQIHFINVFIGDKRLEWGYELWHNLVNGVYWHESGFFPLVTFCDLKRNTISHAQNITIQCVLMVNVINEKLFLILYFWFISLFILTTCNFLFSVCLVSGFGQGYIVKSLFKNCGKDVHVRIFIATFLGSDGLLLLRFVQNQAGSITAYELASTLYELNENNMDFSTNYNGANLKIKNAVVSLSQEKLLTKTASFSYA